MWTLAVTGYLPRSPNASSRQHFGRRMEESRFWDAVLGEQAFRNDVPRAVGKRSVEIVLERKGGTKLRDADNLVASVKHCLDALTRLELIVDDDADGIELVGVSESNGHKRYRTIIVLGETE